MTLSQGDGQTCQPMPPCQVANGGCHPMAVCVSNGAGGMVQCFCRAGFTGWWKKSHYWLKLEYLLHVTNKFL